MRQFFITLSNYVIEYTFYAIFLTVPFAFTDKTFELFEFNKMWLTFGYTIVIATAWICKMIAQKRVFIQKTPLDIPIGLFLLSQIISTIFSMDQHLSIWGYYSRWNGGLLSLLSYICLYYAFASNISLKHHDEQEDDHARHHTSTIVHAVDGITFTKRVLLISIIAATGVALWGLPSHFGYDPTCLMFRGTFDVSCWTADFQPKIRIFSTLGQPNWLAAYLAVLLPVALAFGIHKVQQRGKKIFSHTKDLLLAVCYFSVAALFYLDVIYTDSQSGFLGVVGALGIFVLGLLYITRKKQYFMQSIKVIAALGIAAIGIVFFTNIPITQLKPFTLPYIQAHSATATQTAAPAPVKQAGTALEGGTGGTESSTIRKYVWTGAINAWKDNPLFGTGVETFAFAYYKYRPVGHNMTSEWDFLYNKAHNEYLNYLATTGAFGLLTYLSMIFLFLYFSFRALQKEHGELFHKLLIISLAAGYVSLLISNFFGFSVVIGNVYLFIIPIFVLLLADMVPLGKAAIGTKEIEISTSAKHHSDDLSGMQWTGIFIICGFALYQLYVLLNFWVADTSFALASNLDKIGQYQQGYTEIRKALALRGDEPTFKEELANSDAAIAVALIQQKQNGPGTQLANEAMQTINELTAEYPNNLNFLKSQVRVYYTLGQLNPAYMTEAVRAMEKAHVLAPTDAKIAYNLGVLYGQTGQTQRGIDILSQTLQMKPDYHEVYYALGLFYRDAAVDKNGKVIHPDMEQKAVEQMQFILKNFNKDDKAATDALKSWGEL